MKKFLILTITLTLFVGAFSQKLHADKVPAAVKEALQKAHPNVAPSWEMEAANYEANFKENNREMSCMLDPQGNIIETETMISTSELPAATQNYMQQHYKGKKSKEQCRIEKASGQVYYEVEIAGKELLFDDKGNFVEEEKEEKEKD